MHSDILERRTRRAQKAGPRIAILTLWLTCPVAVFDLFKATRTELAADLVLALGAAHSLLLFRQAGKWGRAAGPFYLMLLVSCFLTVWPTGGLVSPFMALSSALLLVCGVTIQSWLPSRAVFALTAAYVLFFAARAALFGIPPFMPPHTLAYAFKFGAALTGLGLCVHELLCAEKQVAAEAVVQSEQLAEARENLIHAARIAELGNLVSTTAHELAQPAQVIAGVSTLMARRQSSGTLSTAELERFIARSQDASERILSLLRELRNFSRKDTFQSERLEVRGVLESVLVLIGHNLHARGIELIQDLPDEPVEIEADRLRLQQVLLNLLNNATDATGGTDDPSIRIAVTRHPQHVRISVANTGPAIPLEVQGRLFQRYFTTKEKGRGTGLGLAICAQIIERHQGRLYFSSEPGNTVFIVELPRLVGRKAPALDLEREPGLAARKPTEIINLFGSA